MSACRLPGGDPGGPGTAVTPPRAAFQVSAAALPGYIYMRGYVRVPWREGLWYVMQYNQLYSGFRVL